jgi:hypothetical protein
MLKVNLEAPAGAGRERKWSELKDKIKSIKLAYEGVDERQTLINEGNKFYISGAYEVKTFEPMKQVLVSRAQR